MIACCCGKINSRQAMQNGIRSRQYIYRYRYQSNSGGAISQNANQWNVNGASNEFHHRRNQPRFENGTTNTSSSSKHSAHIHNTSPETQRATPGIKSIFAVDREHQYGKAGSKNPCLQLPPPETLEMNSSSVSDASQHSKAGMLYMPGRSKESLEEF